MEISESYDIKRLSAWWSNRSHVQPNTKCTFTRGVQNGTFLMTHTSTLLLTKSTKKRTLVLWTGVITLHEYNNYTFGKALYLK